MSLAPTLDILEDRSAMLRTARAFFEKKGLIEVDCCALNPHAAIDTHIESIDAAPSDSETGFLHTSPEYTMKQLLARGAKDLYFLGHVFRKGDLGAFHNPEFTMAEWYRLNISLSELIQETAEFLFLFFPPLPLHQITYRAAWMHYAGFDYTKEPLQFLQKVALRYSAQNVINWDKGALLDFLFSHLVIPHLGCSELTVLIDFPAPEAALARLYEKDDEQVAERFEIYHQGIELANGYHELSDTKELLKRFHTTNALRTAAGKAPYSINKNLIHEMSFFFPDCCGVSVGFDRAFMLRHHITDIRKVLAFAWPNTNHPIDLFLN